MPMSTPSSSSRKPVWFVGYLAVCLALYWRPLWELLRISLAENTYSHILIVPFISIALVFMDRQKLQQSLRPSLAPAAAFVLGFAALRFADWRYGARLPEGATLALTILSLLALIWAGVMLAYGARIFHSLLFPLLFLLLAVPLPPPLVDRFIYWLQVGSADVTAILFRLTGTPFLRHGFLFFVPQFTIEIAKECSGIRSAIALFITCLLAGYLFLRSGWSRIVLLVSALPVLVIKNGVRIVTLTLLSIYVDPGFLSGDLHREGGFIFFLIGLLILWPVLWGLQALEAKHGKASSGPSRNAGGSSPVTRAAMTPNS